MSQDLHGPPPPDPVTAVPKPKRRLGAEEIGFVVLLVLSLVGMAVADFSRDWGLTYWLAMVPLFAVASVYSGWTRARGKGEEVSEQLVRQLVHWGVLALAVWVIFLFESTGRLNREDAGLVALLALALTTLLAGVHFDWRLAVLGVLLGVAAGAAALVEEFFWVMLLLGVVVGAGMLLWHRLAEKPPPGP